MRLTVPTRAPVNTFDLLDQMVDILGTTRTFFWPFLESSGTVIQSYREQDEPLAATDSGSEGFHPYRHSGGVHSLHFEAGDDQHLVGADAANLSHFGSTDAAFSLGCFFYIDSGTGTLIAKYDVAGTAREYKLDFAAGPDLRFVMYDESADKEEGVQTTAALNTRQWYLGIATYSGVGGAPGVGAGQGVTLYVDGVAVADTDIDDNGYVDMEDLGCPLMIGATDDSAAPASEFTGRIALPFICGKELSAGEVAALYGLGVRLLGV